MSPRASACGSDPPRLPGAATSPAEPRRHGKPVWLGLIVAFFVLLGARAIEYGSIPLPRCGLRALTGVPCPLCGSTRAIVALSHGDLGRALLLNPLVTLALVALVAWGIFAWVRPGGAVSWGNRMQRQPWPAVLLAVVLVNWVYLIFRLPK